MTTSTWRLIFIRLQENAWLKKPNQHIRKKISTKPMYRGENLSYTFRVREIRYLIFSYPPFSPSEYIYIYKTSTQFRRNSQR